MTPGGLFLAVVVAVIYINIDLIGAPHTEVECFPNSTITLTNPIPDALFYGAAIDQDSVCNVTFSDDFGLIIIEGCSKSEKIVVQLSDVNHTNGVIGGANRVLVEIMCQEITQGSERNITNGLGVNLVPNENVQLNQTFNPFSYIRNGSATGPPIGSAAILDEVYFTYDIDSDYVMRFLQCTAYAGRDTTTFPNNHRLIENDCSVDTQLINSFSPNKTVVIGNNTRYYTEITMFRFWVSMYLTIACDVKICLKEHSAPCTMAVCGDTRRRRAAVEDDHTDEPDVQILSSKTTIKVIENPDFIFTEMMSGSGLPESSFLLTALIIVAAIKYRIV